MNTRGRFGFGVRFVAVGVAVWTALLWAYEPVGRASAHREPGPGSSFEFSSWLSTGRDVRLSALVLGVGGLLITARGWRPGGWLALALGVAWCGADIALDTADVVSIVAVVAAGLTVAAIAATIIVASARRRESTDSGRAWWLLGYAGMAVGVATAGHGFERLDPTVGYLAIFALVLSSALVAGVAVNPAGTSTGGRGLVAALIVLAIAVFLPSYFGWWASALDPYGSTSFWLWELVRVAYLLPLPLVAAAAIAMTGALSRVRRAVAVPVVVLALIPAASARNVSVLPWLPTLVVGDRFGATDGQRYLPGQLIGGLVLGVTACVLARLATVAFASTANDVGPAAAPGLGPKRRWTTLVGLVLAAAGVVGWALAEAIVAPAARAVDHGQPISIHITAPLIGWAASLRWGAILLAWGGLLLADRTRGRGRFLAAGVLAWFAADIVVAVIGVSGWLAAGVGAVVAGVWLVFVSLTRAPRDGVAPGSVGYAAAASGAGIQLMAVKAFMPQYLPSWAFQLGLAVSLLLVVAAAVHTLTTGFAVRVGHIVGAIVVIAAGTAGAVLHYVTARQDASRSGEVWVLLTLVAAVVVAATACAFSSGGGLRRWWALPAAAAVVLIGALPLFVAAAGLAYVPQNIAFGLDGLLGLAGEWYDDTFAGAILGASVALLALSPRALSTPDSPLATEPPPPPPQPLDPPARPAPVAVPGVPEVLSWASDPGPVPVR